MRNIQIPAALALVVNQNGKYLITLRNDQKNKQTHNKWEIPGGGIEFGETPEDAVIRETKEEVGLDVTIIHKRPIVRNTVWKHPKKRVHVVLLTYVCKMTNTNQRVVMRDKEVLDYRWITSGEIESFDYLPHLDTIIYEADKLLNSS